MAAQQRWRDLLIAVLSVALAGGALVMLLGPLHPLEAPGTSLELPWWSLAPLFTVTELVVVTVQARRESLSLSFSEVPLVLGLAFCDPDHFVAASVVGAAVGLLWQRQTGLKLAFNLSLFALEAAVAQWVYHAVLGGAGPTEVRGFLAVLVTAVVAQALTSAVVTLVVSLKVGELDAGVLREAMSSALVVALANSCVGLLVVVLAEVRPAALLLLAVVVATLVLAYRGYSALSRGHARLEALYRFTGGTGDAVETDAVVAAVLRQARDVLTAGRAELVLLPPEGSGPARRVVCRDDGGVESSTVLPTPAAATAWGEWWAGAASGLPVHAHRGEVPGIRDGLAVPLRTGNGVRGVLVVADRPHHLDSFSDADLRLFTSLANHAGLSLQKAFLLEELRREAEDQEHRSLHDPVTGLPNRRKLLHRLASSTDETSAVLVVDLDGFKDVNGALGYEIGDQVLVEVGRRLRAVAGPDDVARLGNDEFAVLLSPVPDETAAAALAQQVLDGLAAPLRLGSAEVEVRVTAGLAMGRPGAGAEVLLRHADTALYVGKDQRRGTLFRYDPVLDTAEERLRLTGDLRAAIADGQLDVHYQPQTHPVTGDVLGAEALVRWTHPDRGPVSPEQFVALAEHTGLINPLTDLVLTRALRACTRWRAAGHAIDVAVNLSARSLAEDLPGRVQRHLSAAGLPAEALTLEITETAVMTDVTQALAVLRGLRDVGVRLSVDDFGTGQSSLAYLKGLPITEMKVDRAFVRDLAVDEGDAALVRAAVGLGHALGLRVVAEGVEDGEALRRLASASCDAVQGYFVSRPLPEPAFESWLARRRATRDPRRATDRVIPAPRIA